MNNYEFMELVEKKILDAKGRAFHLGEIDSGYHTLISSDPKTDEGIMRLFSETKASPFTLVNWGIELVLPDFENIQNFNLDYLNHHGKKRGFVSLSFIASFEPNYRLTSDDFQTVTDAPINKRTKKRSIPDLQGLSLEEALPKLFHTIYKRK